MDAPLVVALVLANAVGLFGLFTLALQLRRRRDLARVMPEDERRYAVRKIRRRVLTGVVLVGLGGMLAWTYLSGFEARATDLGERAAKQNAARAAGEDVPAVEMTPEEREFVRSYTLFWMLFLSLLALLLTLAVFDLLATRAFAARELRQMRADHRAILERDLAVYRQQRANDRMKGM